MDSQIRMIRRIVLTCTVFAGLTASYTAVAQACPEIGCIARCHSMGMALEDCVYICIPM